MAVQDVLEPIGEGLRLRQVQPVAVNGVRFAEVPLHPLEAPGHGDDLEPARQVTDEGPANPTAGTGDQKTPIRTHRLQE